MGNEVQLQRIIDKEAIRDLVLLYARAIDRKDPALLRDLYTADATDSHGDSYDGSADGYCDFIERSFPYMPYSGHHVCNHLISVDGDEGGGEVYGLAYHLIPDGAGGQIEDFMAVRYIDNYRREADGRWRFSKRVVTYDLKIRRPFEGGGSLGQGERDPSYQACLQPLFARGRRAGPA
jgi:ketosteroid isomerase-like protein